MAKIEQTSLNSGITELIFFHSLRHILYYDGISIKFNELNLYPVNNIKYFGSISK